MIKLLFPVLLCAGALYSQASAQTTVQTEMSDVEQDNLRQVLGEA